MQEILPAIKVESLPMTPEQEAVWYKRKKEISQQENEALYNGIVKEFENNLLYCADEISFIKQTIDLVKDHVKNIEAIPVLNSNGLPKEKRRKPNRTQMLLPCYRKYIEYLENKLKEYLQPTSPTTTDKATHREVIIADEYKIQAGIEDRKTADYWKRVRGTKAYQQYYTVTYGSKQKAPNEKELKTVIKLLEDYPTAQKIAINKLAELESL